MTEEFVTLETAKSLKEKGFNWKCEHTISCDNIIRRYDIPQSMSCCTEIDNEPVEFFVSSVVCCPKVASVKLRTCISKYPICMEIIGYMIY